MHQSTDLPLKICIIQTAFPGDVVLALGLIESLHLHLPDAELHVVVRAGNEQLLQNHPYISKVHIWYKKQGKWTSLWHLASQLRAEGFYAVINAQRFFSSGLLTLLTGAYIRIGFDKNPLAFTYTHTAVHDLNSGLHETERNWQLLKVLWPNIPYCLPKLYPDHVAIGKAQGYHPANSGPFVCIAPGSVWFTKQYPATEWVKLINQLPAHFKIYLLGGPAEIELANQIKSDCSHAAVENLCGQLSFLESAAMMQGASMNYTCDSAPLHLAGAVSAPVTAVFCSTIPAFGFGPMHKPPLGFLVETSAQLNCKPCGLHGQKTCPQGHFKCATTIRTEQLLAPLALHLS